MLTVENALFVLVDLQEKLTPAIHEHERVVERTAVLVQGLKALGVPMLWTEQNPAGLGPTVPALADLMAGEPITKMAFSCCGEPAFMEALRDAHRDHVILAGIETHVCVYQTAEDLLAAGCEAHVVADAVGSRAPGNRTVGIEKMRDAGVAVTSVETVLFELMKTAEHPAFRDILRIVK